MRYTKKITREETKIARITCDLCGADIVSEPGKINAVKIQKEVGEHYPEGGFSSIYYVDMCGDCFDAKLKPWLENQGVHLIEERSDW